MQNPHSCFGFTLMGSRRTAPSLPLLKGRWGENTTEKGSRVEVAQPITVMGKTDTGQGE